ILSSKSLIFELEKGGKMAKSKQILVLGASENPERYSNKAIRMLRKHGYAVVGIGNRNGRVGEVAFSKEHPAVDTLDIDTVTLYLNAKNQEQYYDYIVSLHPRRMIFNPGAENSELEKLAAQQ